MQDLAVPQPGQGHHLAVLARDRIRLLGAVRALLLFVKHLGRHQAASPRERGVTMHS
jgi:hypothetical protein